MTSQIRVDEITNRSGLGTVTIYDNGFEFTGVTTFTEDVDITGGLTIGGVLTYEDVTNIDSVGVVTARGGLDVSDTGTPVNIDSTNSGLNKIHFKTGGTTSGYLGNSSTYFLSLSDSSGNQRVRHANSGLYQVLDTSGNVIHQMSGAGSIGIGTAPVGDLTVLTTGNGYIDISGSGGNGAEIKFLKKSDKSQTYTIQNNGGVNELVQHVVASTSGQYSWYIGGQSQSNLKLRITSTGTVGLCTVSPAARLHVHAPNTDLSTIRLSGTASNQVEYDIRQGIVGVNNAGFSIRDVTNSATRIAITAAGLVGIGEDSPDRLLHIKGASSTAYSGGSDTADYNFLKIENTTDDRSAGIFFQIGGNGEAAITATEVSDGATNITFQNRGGGVRSEKLRITSDGNIGIDKTDPYYKLHMSFSNATTSLSGGTGGNWGGDGIRIENVNTTVGSMSLAHFRTYDADWHIGNKYVTANNSDFIFSSESNERLRITSDGKMGVGTASPNHKLTLHNSGTGTFDALNITSGLTNSVGLQLGIDSASNVFFWHTANGGIKFATNNVERARVTNNGITFNGDTAADNALNDYEQGTWNPTMAFGGSSTGVSYSERQGIYVKIGNLVWASIVISLTSNGTGTGDVSITLPFTVGSNSENRGIGTLAYFAGFAGLNSNPNIYASSGGATTCRLQHLNNGGGGNGTQVTTLTHGNIGNTAGIRGAIMYTTI